MKTIILLWTDADQAALKDHLPNAADVEVHFVGNCADLSKLSEKYKPEDEYDTIDYLGFEDAMCSEFSKFMNKDEDCRMFVVMENPPKYIADALPTQDSMSADICYYTLDRVTNPLEPTVTRQKHDEKSLLGMLGVD